MASENNFIKRNAVKASVKSKKMRSRADAIDLLCDELNCLIGVVLDESERLAKDDRKSTILKRYVEAAIQKHIGKSDLDWNELLPQILQEPPADLGKLSKGIRDYIKTNSEAS